MSHDLHHCPNCGSEAANLAAHWEHGDTHLLCDIMCGECLTWRSVLATQEECERWEAAVLDPGCQHIAFIAGCIYLV